MSLSTSLTSESAAVSAMAAADSEDGLTLVVVLLDGSEIQVEATEGRHIKAETLRDLVATYLNIPEEDRKLFAIWVMSSSLQLQVRDNHLPLKMVKYWDDLMEQFTEKDPLSERPVLCFKKDAMTHVGVEENVSNEDTLLMFFRELTYNVVYALYPCTMEDAVLMAAIHLQMAVGHKATRDDVSSIEGCLQPRHLNSKAWTRTWEKKVMDCRCNLGIPHDRRMDLLHKYLQIGRNWVVYGCTFFWGDIEEDEASKKRILQDTLDKHVRVGVNFDGIHIIDDAKDQLLVSLPYDQFSYNTYTDTESGNMCFFVEYDIPDAENPETVVIWTKQASLIDELVTRYIEETAKYPRLVALRQQAKGYITKSLRTSGGRFQRSKAASGSDNFAANVLTRMRTMKLGALTPQRTFSRWSQHGPQGGAATAVAKAGPLTGMKSDPHFLTNSASAATGDLELVKMKN